MVINRNLSAKKIQKKLKKKRNKKKHKISSACNIPDASRSIQSSQVSQLMLDNQARAPNNKIQKLIQDIVQKPSREKIVLLFIEAAQKSETCLDFEIGFWLNQYSAFEDEINFTEAALLIINAASIYARKVDFFNQFVRSCIAQSEIEDAAAAATGAENNETRPQAAIRSRKQAVRRPLSLHDRLYEAEMITKQFKTLPMAKTTEILSSMTSMEAPTLYFRKWKEYKTWRLNHKKKMKSPVPYSIVCDDSYLHPAMWRLSCIEDFDYDDDIDTKRSYRMFTHYTEHRYGTLVPDINFIMHFKVKDYIEAEEDEIEIMNILGLPAPPTRQWPPFCKTSYSREFVKEKYNIDMKEDSEDYIKKYVALEDIVLENEVYEIDDKLFRSAAEARKNGCRVNDVIKMLPAPIADVEMNQIVPEVDETLESEPVETTSREMEVTKNPLPVITITEVVDKTNSIVTAAIPEPNENNINAANLTTVPNLKMPSETIDFIPSDSDIQVSEPYTLDSSGNTLNPTRDSFDLTPVVNSDAIVTQQENHTRPTPKNALQIISESIQNNITDQIVIRISVDEGVPFSDLDDLDRAMLSPVVELVDILSPIKEEIIEPISITVDKTMKNLFEIDENYLSYEENFRLPFEVLYNQPAILYNFLKLPESKLKRKLIFSLPTDYDAFKSCRLKRKHVEKPIPKRRNIKMFKLNNPDITDVPITPPGTPNREQDFMGFDEDEMDFDGFARGEIFSSTLSETLLNSSQKNIISPNRTISRDSGIELSTAIDSQVSYVDVTNSQDVFSEADLAVHTSTPVCENYDAEMESLNSPLPVTNSQEQESCIGEQNAIERLTKRIADDLQAQSSENSTQKKNDIIEKKVCEMNQMMERIQKWHRHLKPILAKSKERHHFDIFGIGTEIIETFSTDKSTITLDDVMVKNDPSFLSRYFLSTLQLANSNNVQIKVNNPSPALPIPLCNIELKLLSRQRHSISMEDDIGAHSSSSRKRRHSAISAGNESRSRNQTQSTKNVGVTESSSQHDQGASSHSIYNEGASTSKRIPVSNSNQRKASSKLISENNETYSSVSLRNAFNDAGESSSSQVLFQNQKVPVANRNQEATINRDVLLPNLNQSSLTSRGPSTSQNCGFLNESVSLVSHYSQQLSSKNDARIEKSTIESLNSSAIRNPLNFFHVPLNNKTSSCKYSEPIVNANHHIFNDSEEISESNLNDRSRDLQKYKESNRAILSNEVNAHTNDYIRLLSEKHDINLFLYLTPEDINNVLKKQQQENNSFAECLIIPTQVRNQTIDALKRSHSDDLDSGFFSEFSSIDNNSFIT